MPIMPPSKVQEIGTQLMNAIREHDSEMIRIDFENPLKKLTFEIFTFISNDYGRSSNHRAVAKGKGGGGFLKVVALGATSWFLGGKIHSSRTLKKLKTKHMKDQKKLYSQYYNDVYKLQQQNAELQYVAEQYKEALKQVQTDWENDKLQRDWDEFKQPDVDGDEKISRAEFNMYVKNYLANYPGLTEKDYPKFEDFDHDGDGYISFQEYAQQMALTVQQAEKEKAAKVGY